MGEKRPRPVASPLRSGPPRGLPWHSERKAKCVAKVAMKVAKVAKVAKAMKVSSVKSVKVVISARAKKPKPASRPVPKPPRKAARGEGRQGPTAVRKALEIYQTLHDEYVKITTEKQDYTLARELCAKHVAKIYGQLHSVALELLQSVAPPSSGSGGSSGANYRVLQFRGEASDRRRRLSDRLTSARCGCLGQRRDALCAVLAALCCRLQKNWLAAYDDEVPARGYFVHALVDPSSCFRVAMRMRPRPRLASLLVTSEAPLGKALALMDHGGPFPEGHEKEPLGDRQYAMQRVLVEGGYGDDEKEKLCDLQPEAQLRKLMGSEEPVLVLDVYCALAPKEHVQRHDLGPIIRAELQSLLREAKERGQAVVLVVGGEQPVELARKVYLQPCFTDIGGLMCGYFRWKAKASSSLWEPPKLMGQKRVIFGLQLP